MRLLKDMQGCPNPGKAVMSDSKIVQMAKSIKTVHDLEVFFGVWDVARADGLVPVGDLRAAYAIAEDTLGCFREGVAGPIPAIRPNTPNGLYDRVEVSDVRSIPTRNSDLFNSYVLRLDGGYALSIVTGSHPNSAELGTFEIALMRNGLFAFGDEDTDASIIPHVDLEEAILMAAQMRRHPQEIESIFLRHY